MINVKKTAMGLSALAALALGGSAIANATTTTPTTGTTPPAAATRADFPAHGSAAHEDAEKAVTGSDAGKAQAAAVKSVGSGTAGEVTASFQGGGYEVTVKKADGSTTDVRLDSSFKVEADGGGHGGDHGGGPGDNDSAGA